MQKCFFRNALKGFEWGNGNGEVPPGQNVDGGNIVNNGGSTPPGLNRRNQNAPDKDKNPNKPEIPENPGTEDSSDKNADKAQQGTHIYTYDELNRMVTSDIAKVKTTYTYDTLGNLTYEKAKNKSPNKLLNNDHGNYVYAIYTGHIFDTTLDIYFAEARFYDPATRTWMAMDPVKDGDRITQRY